MQLNNVVIIGWQGFIGSNFINYLSKLNSNYNIYLHDKNKVRENKPSALPGMSCVNYEELIKILNNKKQTSAVLYLANSHSPQESLNNIVESVCDNIIPFINFLNDIKDNASKINFLLASSGGSVYGDTGGNACKEDHSLSPKSIYSANKIAQEYYLNVFNSNYGLNYLVLRIANPYGPGQRVKGGQGLIPAVLDAVFLDKPIHIYGDGLSKRDYIYIDDVCECIYKCLSYNGEYNHFNLGSGIEHSITDILNKIEIILGMTVKKEYFKEINSNVDSIVLDITRVTSEMDWRPKTSLLDGVKKYIEWYKANVTLP